MALHFRLFAFLLCCVGFFTERAFSQSLSAVRTGDGEYWLHTAAPRNTRYILQASANLRLWVDINDNVTGVSSNRLDVTGGDHRFFRLSTWGEPAPTIRLMLLGDSTVANGVGWGTAAGQFMRPNVQFVNYAQNAYSTKVFLGSEQKDNMMLLRPNFVLIQFGLIDEGGCQGPGQQCHTTLPEYEANLKTIVGLVREFDGTPILITPPSPRLFTEEGALMPLMVDHANITRKVAAELQTHLVDLHRLTGELFTELGDSGSEYISVSLSDPYHFSTVGQEIVSALVMNALPPELGPYLQNIFDQPAQP